MQYSVQNVLGNIVGAAAGSNNREQGFSCEESILHCFWLRHGALFGAASLVGGAVNEQRVIDRLTPGGPFALFALEATGPLL